MDIVTELNAKSHLIALEIQQEIERSLPPSVSVRSQIAFKEGSIALAGVIAVLDWMDLIAGATDFTVLFAKVIKIAVEQVIRPWLTQYDPIQVRVIPQTTVKHEKAVRPDILRSLAIVTGINTVLLLLVLVIQLTR